MGGCDRFANLKLVELVGENKVWTIFRMLRLMGQSPKFDVINAVKSDQWILCIICLLYKKWSDEEASRLFYINEKMSAEWPLLTKITWTDAGSLFADVTYGSYVIITFALLIGHCVGELQHSHRMETILMGLGALLFIGVGCLEICGVDLLQHELVDNALILGILSILTGMLFIFDIGTIPKRNGKAASKYQSQNMRIAQEKMAARKDITVAANTTAAFVPEKPAADHVEIVTSNGNGMHTTVNGHMNGGAPTTRMEMVTNKSQKREAKAKEKAKNGRNKEASRADIIISNPIQTENYPMDGSGNPAYALDQPDYELDRTTPTRPKSGPVANGYPMAGMVPIGELRSSLRKRLEKQEDTRRAHFESAAANEKTLIEMDLRKVNGSDIPHRRSSITFDEDPYGGGPPYASEKDHTHSSYYDSKEHTKIFTRAISEQHRPRELYTESKRGYDPSHFKEVYLERRPDESFRGLTREKRHLSKSLDDTLIDMRAQSPTVTSSQKTPPARQSPGSSDESVLNLQLPSVSYLLAERGKKVLPTVAQSPVERVTESTDSKRLSYDQQNKDKYYYGEIKFPPPTDSFIEAETKSSPKSPRDPGYVLHTASKWPTAKASDVDQKYRWNVNARTQNMR